LHGLLRAIHELVAEQDEHEGLLVRSVELIDALTQRVRLFELTDDYHTVCGQLKLASGEQRSAKRRELVGVGDRLIQFKNSLDELRKLHIEASRVSENLVLFASISAAQPAQPEPLDEFKEWNRAKSESLRETVASLGWPAFEKAGNSIKQFGKDLERLAVNKSPDFSSKSSRLCAATNSHSSRRTFWCGSAVSRRNLQSSREHQS
jgi:hypothetical protein